MTCTAYVDGVLARVAVHLKAAVEGKAVSFDARLLDGVIATRNLEATLRRQGWQRADCGDAPAYPAVVGSRIVCRVTRPSGDRYVQATVTDRSGAVIDRRLPGPFLGQTLPMARVVVVGAGVVGLSCAVRLLEAGHRVDVVARDLPLETTSAVAAALWYPYRAFPHERVAGWSAGHLPGARRAVRRRRHGGPDAPRHRAAPHAGRPTRGGGTPCRS